MKTNILNYTFNASSGVVTFLDYTNIRLDSILLITNVTRNIIIYNFANPVLGGVVSGNSVDLAYNTSSMSNTDSLQIFYDDGQVQSSTNDHLLLRQLIQLFRSFSIVTSGTNRLSIDVNAITTLPTLANVTTVGSITTLPTLANVTTVATVTTVGNQTQMGGISAFDLQYNTARNAFASTTRQNVTF